MSVRMRHTSSHTKNRRSHHALTAASVVTDKESGKLRLPHRLDESTGMYRGKLIVPNRKEELAKAEARKNDRVHKHEHLEGVREPVEVEAEKPEEKSEKKDA